MNRKNTTAWRKSRKFGDVYGGRKWAKVEDHIFRRGHPLKAPPAGTDLPIVIQENPSRAFAFPVSAAETLKRLKDFPEEHTVSITHLWLRRVKITEYEQGQTPFAEYLCGSGVSAIVIYPWPKDLTLKFGARKPAARLLKEYSKWTEDLFVENGAWCLRWTEGALRQFYLDYILAHEIGHHLDRRRRRWSKANEKALEDFADQYALQWLASSLKARIVELEAATETAE